MSKVTMRAERLARALCMTESPLEFGMAFDRAHVYWPTQIEKAKQVIANMNLLEFCETSYPLHGHTEDADDDLAVYSEHYVGPSSHNMAIGMVLHGEWSEDEDEDNA